MLIFLIIHYSPMKLNKFEGNILEKPNSDILLNVIRRHNEFITSDIPNECDKYVPNESNSSHICDVIVSDVGYSPNQCVSSKIPGQWYGVSEETASFPEATTKPVCPDMKFAQVENPNQVQDYSNEYEADACFPFDCFASESSLDESHVILRNDMKSSEFLQIKRGEVYSVIKEEILRILKATQCKWRTDNDSM
uniref:Uncharacterized protein n=1 Tax=Schistosoma mansoni TaxID=6183 RepID=A0A3Q0KUQ0_SCHMA